MYETKQVIFIYERYFQNIERADKEWRCIEGFRKKYPTKRTPEDITEQANELFPQEIDTQTDSRNRTLLWNSSTNSQRRPAHVPVKISNVHELGLTNFSDKSQFYFSGYINNNACFVQ